MCKKLIVLVFCASVLFSGVVMAELDDRGRLIVPGTSVAPIIDGELDDVWQNVGEEGVLITDIINAGGNVPPDDDSDLSGTFKVMYDADNIYFFLAAQDSVIDYEFSNWNGDGVEIYFDGDNNKGGAYDGVNDNQIRITVDDVEMANIESSLPVDGSAFKVILTDLGYNIEAAFPLAVLQLVPEQTFGFEVQLNDNDGGGGRETMIRWFSNDNNSWQDSSLFGEAVLAAEPEGDTLSGLADVTVVDDAIESLRYEGTEYIVADGDLILGTTTRWFVEGGVETLWVEGDPAPAATVSGTSNPKDGDVGSKADNFLFKLNGSTNISSIDGIDFQETIFPSLVDTIIIFERNGNDVGTMQAIHADGSLGEAVAFVKASDGGPYADTGIDVNGQNAYGVVFRTSVPVQGVRITASGHDTLSISAPVYVEPPVMIPVLNAGFEDPVLAEDDWTWLDVPGWTLVGGEGPGIWHVTSSDFDPVLAPEGQNVLYTENAVGDGGGVAQVLTETFAANTDYTLTADVGNSWYYYFAGYSVQLLAGGTVIAEDNDTLWPDYMNWATSTVQYTYDSAHSALVGQPLEIRLLNLGLDKDSPADNTVGVEFDNVTLSYKAGAEPGVTITVEEGGDIAAANELAKAGDTIEIAAGTYYLTSQIEIKDGVTYRGAGPGLTIIDGNNITRAFVAWGDRSFNETNENPNDSGPKGWVLEGMTIQNCVADTNNRFSYTGAAFNLKTNFATLDADASGGLSPDEADGQVGGIRLGGADLTEGTEDDDLHRFEHIDTDGSGELSEAELDAQVLVPEDEYGDENGDGGAITIHNQAVGTIQNCDFLNNHTPIAGDGDDGGAVNIAGLSVITINDCLFNGNYACSPTSVAESDETGDADGDGGHIKVQGASASAITPGTTLIANRCVFLNGNASDDGGAIQAAAVGSVVRLDSCWFEGNTSWDNGNVCQFSNNAQNEVTVTNCVFANNITKADNSPDRMIETNRNSKFINCTFVGNIQEDQDLIYNNANTQDTNGDGVDDETADVTQVINCIFVNNVVGNGDDVLGSRNNDFSIAATNCLFFGNTLQNGNAADNTQRPDVETGSILSDPLLDADLVPGAGSEAIDGGVDPAIVGVTLTNDYNGNERPQGAGYDIGAFEVE